MTPEEYAAEVAAAQRERPNTRFIVYDHEIVGDLAWFRFTLTWTDASTGETHTRAGMQLYREAQWAIEGDHYHAVANPAKGEKPGERGARPPKPSGYQPGRKSQKRRKR